MIANRPREVIDLRVVGHQQPAFHRRNVMREERAERVDVAERAARPAVQAGAHRLAVVFEEVEAVRVAERAHHVERRRIAEDADRDDHPRARRQRRLELRHVHVERLQSTSTNRSLSPYCCSG